MAGVSRRGFVGGLGLAAAARAFGLELDPGRAFSIAGADVEVWLTAVTESTLRVSVIRAGSRMEPAASFAGAGLSDRTWPPVKAKLDGAATVAWGERKIVVSSGPLTVQVLDAGGAEVQRLVFDAITGRVSFELEDAPVFGLGEGGRQFDRRGAVEQMRNGQFKPDQLLNGGRSPIPWLISPKGWGLYFHHPLGTFDLTGKQGVFRPSEPGQPQDLFLVAGKVPAGLLKEFAGLTGMPHLPPIWALGYQQSHRTLGSRESVLAELKTFREKKLPCDVMIYLGTGFAPSGWNMGHGSFAFNDRIFPDPEAMFRAMHGEGFRVVLHVLGVAHDLHGRVGDGALDPDDAANYWQDHRKTFATGIDGWWVDDGDELPPESRLARNRMYWEGSLKERPAVRPFSIQRNGYAGVQQYGFMWSGDVDSRWKTLRVQVASGLNTGLSGIPYWGTDTGGFFTTKELTAELYVRWFQFSAFCTLFRSHGRTWKLRLPWGWDLGTAEPIEDDPKLVPEESELHHPEVEEICRQYLNLRYQMLPYTYSAVWETSRTGMPVMRALWLSFPEDTKAVLVDDAYLWGPSVLVAPVTTAGAEERTVYLPAGGWYAFWTGERIEGGSERTVAAPLETMPIFVRAGGIVPLAPVKQFATEKVEGPLEVRVYPGADGRFTLYEDDGVSMEHVRGVSSRIEMEWSDGERRFSVRLAAGDRMGAFTSRRMVVRVVGGGTRDLAFDGTAKSVVI